MIRFGTSKPAHLAEPVSYDCTDSRVEASDNVTSLVLLRGKKAEQKSQRAQLTPKETKVRNEPASFLAEPINRSYYYRYQQGMQLRLIKL